MATTTFTVTTKNVLGADLRLAIAAELARDITARTGAVAENVKVTDVAHSSS